MNTKITSDVSATLAEILLTNSDEIVVDRFSRENQLKQASCNGSCNGVCGSGI